MSKKMTRREMLQLSGLVTAGSFLAACGGGKSDYYVVDEAALENASGNVVVMHFLHEFTEDHANGFMAENPDITVEVADAEDPTRFYAMLAAGTPPDLYRTQAPDVPQFIARDLLFNLQPFVDVSDTVNIDDLAPANNAYKSNGPTEMGAGDLYGCCKDFSPDQTLFVNQHLFEAAGLEVPGDDNADRLSYAEAYDLAGQLTKFDGDRLEQYGYGVEWGWVGRLVHNMVIETGTSLYSKDFKKAILSEGDAKKGFKYWYDMAANKLTHSTINPSPNGWMGNDFTAGILAMCQYGYWFSAMAATETSTPKMIPAPSWNGEDRDPTVTATGMVMLKASQVPEAAWKVFEYYNVGNVALERAASGWGVPAFKSMYELMPQETDFQKQAFKVVMQEINLDTPALQFNPYLTGDSYGAVWNSNLDLTLTGDGDFDAMIGRVEDEINLLIEEGIERVEATA